LETRKRINRAMMTPDASTPTGEIPSDLSGGPLIPEGSEHFIQVGSDRDFIVEKVLQPQIISALGPSNQRQQIAQPNMNSGLSEFGFVGIK
jgi:hypothetical protein